MSFEKAIDDLTAAIRLDPQFFEAYSNRAVVWVHKGELEQAIDDLTEALRFSTKRAARCSPTGLCLVETRCVRKGTR